MITTCQKLAETAHLVYPGVEASSWFHRIKYCVRGLALGRRSKEWLNLLEQPEISIVARHHPYIFCKLQRPYLNRTLNAGQRLETLKQHYRFVAARFSKLGMEMVYAGSGLLLASMPLEDVGNFGVCLSYGRQEKEGDLLVNLVNLETGMVLFEMSFCISKFDGQGSEIFIGGLQGNRRTNEKELIIAITRALHGLRPKALLVFVLQQLAACWKIAKIRAVSDDNHIYRHPHKRKELAASYDEFWHECGGTIDAEGMFELPVAFIPKAIPDLKVNKRQMYRRRYAELAQLGGKIQESWNHTHGEVTTNSPTLRSE